MEYTQFTSTAAWSSGLARSPSSEPSCNTRSSANAGPSTNTSSPHVNNQIQFIEFFTLTITKEKREMPLPATMGTTVVSGAVVTKFLNGYDSLSSCTGMDLPAKYIITTIMY